MWHAIAYWWVAGDSPDTSSDSVPIHLIFQACVGTFGTNTVAQGHLLVWIDVV